MKKENKKFERERERERPCQAKIFILAKMHSITITTIKAFISASLIFLLN